MTLNKKRAFHFIGIGIVMAWVVMMAVLVKKSHFKPGPVSLTPDRNGAPLEEGETWMAIYHGDEKIGFARSNVRKEAAGYAVFESAVLHLRAVGAVHRVSTEIVGHLNKDTSLRSFVFLIDSGLVRFEAKGRVEGQQLILETGFGGETTETRLMLREPPFLSAGLWPYLLSHGLEVGTRYRLSLFDPSIMAQKPMEVEVVGREEVVVAGKTYDAYKVKTSFSGLEIVTWLDADGDRLKEEGLMGLRMVKTTEAEAQEGLRSDPEIDLAEAVSVPSNKIIEDPSSLTYLKVRLDGISLEGLDLDSGRQHLTGPILEVRRESTGLRGRAHDEQDDLGPYLRAGPFIQSDHPEIKALAHKIVGFQNEGEAKVRQILNWVFKSIEKRGIVSVPNALDTLKLKAGDCNEHAVLFAAIARAAGIPTKISVGLVYTRGRFYYHAWNEVFLGGWETVDALMGQMPADVTHIKFVEGGLGRQADMVRVIGQVELTVIEVD
jgi:hypothetical protein